MRTHTTTAATIDEKTYFEFRALIDKHKAFIQKFAGKSGWISMDKAAQDETAAHVGAVVTNEMRAAVEVYEFLKTPPEYYFAYVNEKTGEITTWMGDVLGRFHFRTKSTRPAMTIWAINGRTYTGQYFPNSGNYCRMKLLNA